MASDKLQWKPSVEGDFKKIDRRYIRRIIERAEALSEDPRPHDSKKLKDAEETYRVRIGGYRILYQIEGKQRAVLILTVRHRKDAYRRR